MKMKSIIITTIIVITIAATTFYRVTVYQQLKKVASIRATSDRNLSGRIRNAQEDVVPQHGDPCSGTGGNGQILNIGNNSITMKLKRDGRLLTKGSSQIINLTSQTMIRTSTGSDSLSNLKKGDNITVGGEQNPDGNFTAQIIAVCTEN